MKSKRKAQQEKRRKRKQNSRLIWGSVAVVVIGVLGYALWVAFCPTYGESIPVMADTNHAIQDEDPGPNNRNSQPPDLIMPMNLKPDSTKRQMSPVCQIILRAN
jgi:cytoskeletal protein RodZ